MHALVDITALYRNIERADLDIAGSKVKDRRSTIFLGVLNDDSLCQQRDDTWRHLLSLNRTLKVIIIVIIIIIIIIIIITRRCILAAIGEELMKC